MEQSTNMPHDDLAMPDASGATAEKSAEAGIEEQEIDDAASASEDQSTGDGGQTDPEWTEEVSALAEIIATGSGAQEMLVTRDYAEATVWNEQAELAQAQAHIELLQESLSTLSAAGAELSLLLNRRTRAYNDLVRGLSKNLAVHLGADVASLVDTGTYGAPLLGEPAPIAPASHGPDLSVLATGGENQLIKPPTDVDAILVQVESLQEELAETDRQRTSLLAQVDQGNEEIVALQALIAELQDSIGEQAAKIEHVAALLSARDGELETLQENIEALQDELQTVVSAEEAELVDAEADSAQEEGDDEAADSPRLAAVGALAGSVTAAVAALRSQEQALADANADIEALNEQITDLQADLAAQTNSGSELQAQLDDRSAELAGLQGRIDEVLTELRSVAPAEEKADEEDLAADASADDGATEEAGGGEEVETAPDAALSVDSDVTAEQESADSEDDAPKDDAPKDDAPENGVPENGVPEGGIDALAATATAVVAALLEREQELAEADAASTTLNEQLAWVQDDLALQTTAGADLDAKLQASNATADELRQGIESIWASVQPLLPAETDTDVADAQSVDAQSDGDVAADDSSDPADGQPEDGDGSETASADNVETVDVGTVGAGVDAVLVMLHDKEKALADAGGLIASLNEQMNAINADLEAEKSAKAAVEAELQARDAELDALQAKINSFRQELSEVAPDDESAADDAQDEDDQASDGVTARKVVGVGALGAGIAAAIGALHDKDQSLTAASENVGALETQASALSGEKGDLEQKLLDSQQEVENGKAQTAVLQATVDDLSVQVGTLNGQLEEAQNNASELQGQVDTLTADAAQKEQALQDASALAASLQATVDENQAKIDEIGGQLETLRSERDQAQTDQAALQVSVATLTDELENAKELAEKSMAEQVAKVGALTVAATVAADTLKEKESASDATNARVAQLEAEIQDLTSLETEMQTKGSEREEELQSLTTNVAGLQDQVTDLEQQLASRSNELDVAAAQLEVAASERDAAIKRLDEYERELEALQELAPLTSAFGRTQAAALAELSPVKVAAANAAQAMGVQPRLMVLPQDLVKVRGLGKVYEQRLYEEKIGTYWEVANVPDDEFKRILKPSDMQLMRMKFGDIRDDAGRMARDTESVGALWPADRLDNFEPIEGIGRIYEQRLYAAGIHTYVALANLTVEQLDEICQAPKLNPPDYAAWISQAQALAEAG